MTRKVFKWTATTSWLAKLKNPQKRNNCDNFGNVRQGRALEKFLEKMMESSLEDSAERVEGSNKRGAWGSCKGKEI